jgi:hypothetical protein
MLYFIGYHAYCGLDVIVAGSDCHPGDDAGKHAGGQDDSEVRE